MRWKVVPNQFYSMELEATLLHTKLQRTSKRILMIKILKPTTNSQLAISMTPLLAFNMFKSYFIENLQIKVY